ncbi:LysR family transcriptional regulator [Mesorhizobium sp. ISC25]|uniref:LysR family transcriptional regulator n=1 Tax=Mesorhizobium sp. ISC25 TaxID=3077335 RepID=UPI0035E264E2
MDLTALRYFFETALAGSIRQAAERVHVAPSAISRQIAKLEHELGTALLERRSNGVRLTPAGELLAKQMQLTVRDITRVRSQIDELKGLRRGEVSVWCIEGLVDNYLPDVIGRFTQQYPEITFNIVITSTDRIVQALIADEAEIGIALNASLKQPIVNSGGWSEPVQAIVAPGHPLANRNSVTLSELTEFKAALPDTTFGVRRLVDRILESQGTVLRVLATTNSIQMTASIARQGIAFTLMPYFAVARDCAAGSLVAVPLAETEMELACVEFCTHESRRLPLAAREFLNFLKSSAPASHNPRKKRLHAVA